MSVPRYLTPAVEEALAAGKMAFVGGPRQVGKTTLALSLLGPQANEHHPAYFNWDDPRSAARLRRVELPPVRRPPGHPRHRPESTLGARREG